MPTYEYICSTCGHEMEVFQSMKDAPLEKCPSCGKRKLSRKIGLGAGLIFKGSGFYETDYKRPVGKSEGGTADDKPKSEAKPEAKPGAASKSTGGDSAKKKPEAKAGV
ncbi:MAG: FmdB family zinc ribbon protein [Puniceicoccaceae bacterium]